MSINQLIDITRRSFQSLNGAMNTVSQNVANANTEGYTRRRVVLKANSLASPGIIFYTPAGTATGAGVSIGSYERMRDSLLAAATYEGYTALGAAQEDQRLLGALEGIFPIGEGSLTSQVSDFFDAFSTLANNPTDNGVRLALRSIADSLTDTFNRTDKALALFQEQTNSLLASRVDEVNGLLNQIAELNETIQSARYSRSPDLVAEDQRDQIVVQLAELVPVQVREDDATAYSVIVNGMTIVQGNHVVEMQLDTSGVTPRVLFGDTQVEYQPPKGSDGKLGSVLRLVTDTLPDIRTALNDMAGALVTEVNTLHSAGFGLDGGTGRDFFDAASLSAGAMRLSADVLADSRAIAASGDATALGDSSVALDIADLRTQPVLNGGTETVETFAINMLTGIGQEAERASTKAIGQAAVLDHLIGMERGISGVSLDEEMTNLIQFQQAFAATARVLSTAQQMMDTLLSL